MLAPQDDGEKQARLSEIRLTAPNQLVIRKYSADDKIG